MFDKSGVYIFEFKTGIYVGSSRHVRRRILRHLRDLRHGRHSNWFMQRVYDRHGAPAVRMVVQCREDDLLMYEQRFIDSLRPRLNLSPTAGRNIGHKHAAHTLAKMKESGKSAWAKRSRVVGQEQRQKISQAMAGRTFSAETCAKISSAKMGHEVSAETRAKISATKCAAKLIYAGRAA